MDNAATTLSGVAARGVAFFHAAPKNATLNQLRLADVHLTCAAALFILLGAISPQVSLSATSARSVASLTGFPGADRSPIASLK
jgi:hypothetical protein